MNLARFEKKFVGSKGAAGVFHRIINEIPPCRVLLEPFAGEATIARKIRPPAEIILIDKVRQPGLVLGAELARRVRFVQGCGLAFVKSYRFQGDEFCYFDPPYLLTTRGGRAYYEHELSASEHGRLLALAPRLNCHVMISGYRSPLYDRELRTWRRVDFPAMTRGGRKVIESIWMNYPAPTALQDYSFVGKDFRARCRLRRKTRNAVADLISMPALERGAMFDALCRAMGASPAPIPACAAAPAARAENGAAAGEAMRAALERAIASCARHEHAANFCGLVAENAGRFTFNGRAFSLWVELLAGAVDAHPVYGAPRAPRAGNGATAGNRQSRRAPAHQDNAGDMPAATPPAHDGRRHAAAGVDLVQ